MYSNVLVLNIIKKLILVSTLFSWLFKISDLSGYLVCNSIVTKMNVMNG